MMIRQCSTSILFFSVVLLVLPSCAVKLKDETGPNLTYNPPLNLQTFEAEVSRQGSVTINGVSVAIEDGGVQPLTGVSVDSHGVGLWQGDASIAACQQAVAYRFIVDYKAGSNKTKTFPEEGAFVQSIEGTDPLCDGISSASKTFYVNSVEDVIDANPGDGICSTVLAPENPDDVITDGGDPPCTLRAAIMEANARAGFDLIRVPVGRYKLTRVKSGTPESDNIAEDAWGDLDITDSVAIIGDGADYIHIGRFMQTSGSSYQPGGYLEAVDDKIDRPDSDLLFSKIDGGEIDRVFDIHVNGEKGFAYLHKLAILNGHANDRPGAGIFNQGRLRLERVAIYDNELSQLGGGGGVFSSNTGVGIANNGTLVADEIAVVNNRVNRTTGYAGGLWVNPNSQATITNSLFALNKARFYGAIYIGKGEEGDSPGRLSLSNVTVAYNINTGSVDNAIYNDGELTLNFVTIVNNNRGGLRNSSASDTEIRNSLLANNGGLNDCNGGPADSFGGNIIKDSSCTFGGSPLNPDIINTTQTVSASSLTYEGGFTYVVRIRPPYEGTTTILDPTDRISGAIPKPDSDQRGDGFARAVDADGSGDAEMDPGAFEYIP